MKKILFSLCLFIAFNSIIGQAIYEEEKYIPETDPLVLEKINQWQDLKFGLLMHWGAYSQWGIVESWSICPEEYGWCERKMGENPDDYYSYVKEYEQLKNTFNPVEFNPEPWAKAAKDAGMKYVVFTTKHHDGFCMFDTKLTDYKVTDKECPFSENPKSDITGEIFEAFRNEGLWTGAYFSKPDWHSPYYWDPYYPPRDRNVNYEPEANPEKWNSFIEFTHGQIMELLTNYGNVDILWLDGGWVAKEPKEKIENWYEAAMVNNPNGYLKHRIINQDIKMDSLVQMARKVQPGLIVVDRAVHGKNQNYLTPENRIPHEPLPFPWESCIISGGGWSHTKNAKYMSGREGITTLVEIVSKGGNLLLNIAPTPQGKWQNGAYELLGEFADWMKVNSEGIYCSSPIYPYKSDNMYFTKNKDGDVYCFLKLDKDNGIPYSTLRLPELQIKEPYKIEVLGTDQKIKFSTDGGSIKINIPGKIRKSPPSKHFIAFKISVGE